MARAHSQSARQRLLPLLLMTAAVLCVLASRRAPLPHSPAAGGGGGLRLPPLTLRRRLAAASGAAPAPAPAPQAEESVQLFYAAVYLDEGSQEELLEKAPPLLDEISADHMTIAFQPSLEAALALPLGRAATLTVLGAATDNRTQGLAVEHPDWVPFLSESVPHITISVAEGVPAKDTGDMIRAALATPGALAPVANLTELHGTVGVQLTDGSRVYLQADLLAALGLDGQAAAPAPAPEAAT